MLNPACGGSPNDINYRDKFPGLSIPKHPVAQFKRIGIWKLRALVRCINGRPIVPDTVLLAIAKAGTAHPELIYTPLRCFRNVGGFICYSQERFAVIS